MKYRAAQAAELLGASADTIRRWADAGRINSAVSADGKRYFEGENLAKAAVECTRAATPKNPRAQCTRNRFIGIVAKVVKDKVVAQIDIQAGPHHFVSIITREATDAARIAPRRGVIRRTRSEGAGEFQRRESKNVDHRMRFNVVHAV